MITVAIANQKGGVGKTSTTINLAGALARLGKKVLLVDLDPQGSLTEYFFHLTELQFTMYDILIGMQPQKPMELGEALGLLPANIDLAAAEVKLPLLSNSDKRLWIELKKYTGYDYCLIDCPPSLGHLTKNALGAANLILIPVSTDLMALRTVRLIMDSIQDVQYSELNRDLKVWHILPTRHKLQGNEAKQVFQDLLETYKGMVYLEPVMERENYKKAVRGQVDIGAVDSELGRYWLTLAQDLIKVSEVAS